MALDTFAEISVRKGLVDEADAAVQESLKKYPNGAAALMLRARILLARSQFEEAETAAREVLAVKDDIPAAWATLALVLTVRMEAAERKGDADGAEVIRMALIEAREGCLRLEPRQPQVLVDLARDRLAGRPTAESARKALEELTRAIEMQPTHILAHNNRAIANLRVGITSALDGRAPEADERLKAALADAETAIRLSLERFGPPGYDKGWANKAYVLWKMNDFAGAAGAAAETRKINPAYVFNPLFVASMEANGRPIPPPAGK
jgi:tetratricopeptide (TPR) repeat protein